MFNINIYKNNMEDISNKRYITNDEMNDDTWTMILKIADTYRNCIIDNEIIKGGSYYPRLVDSEKRGLRAYKEFKTYFHNKFEIEVDEKFMEIWLNIFIKCKTIPKVEFDSLVVCNSDYIHKLDGIELIKLLFENKQIKSQFEPYDQIVHEYPEISEDEKIQNVLTLIETLEFQPTQILKLQNKINDYIIQNM